MDFFNNTTGKVVFVSAGPGDPDLITLKAIKYLEQADVVLTDRLVSEEILQEHVNHQTRVIYVGKQSGKSSSTSQTDINVLMLQYAMEGNLVVRLKGGDAMLFSNILDELQTLRDADIPFEIIPGVTAALGAAAYSGIPLTARGYSRGVRFLTYLKSSKWSDQYWEQLSQTDDTLVFYMSSETLTGVVSNLIRFNIPEDKLVAVVEQATTPLQQVFISDLRSYERRFGPKNFASPSLVIIGSVVSLHEQFSWFQNGKTMGNYFKPIEDGDVKIENEYAA